MQYPLIKPRYYLSLFKDIVNFVRKPTNKEQLDKPTKLKIYDTIGLFVVKLFFLVPASVLIGLLHDPENLTKASFADRFSLPMMFLVAVIILPIIEEVCFRLSLKFRPIYLALSSGVLLYYLLTKAVYRTSNTVVDESFFLRLGLAIGFIVLLYPILSMKAVSRRLALLWDNNFRFIYYASCILFAGVHIFNYELNWLNLVLLPLITLPQLFSGIISGYTRVSFGFQYPLLFHISTNLIAVCASLLPFADFFS
jgi:hypothetical protein